MSKYCYNYESGKYEWIEEDGYSVDRGDMFTTGMTASTVVKKRSVLGMITIVPGNLHS